jgi:hypothetical protein
LLPKAPSLIPCASANVLSLENLSNGFDTEENYGLFISMYVPGPGTYYFVVFLLHDLSSLEPKGTRTASSIKSFALISSFFLS